ncbi:hypothetical protein HYQ45_000972 [Verticillium longisporum]|uniref:Uncharacterized protein n=1 Tax=Verticillium longisporum TaxID=100787 RepID=A0A8I3AX43_VERLO|nr:hypothetical protein HYQ45_000972 [Verticillium longisporum]
MRSDRPSRGLTSGIAGQPLASVFARRRSLAMILTPRRPVLDSEELSVLRHFPSIGKAVEILVGGQFIGQRTRALIVPFTLVRLVSS